MTIYDFTETHRLVCFDNGFWQIETNVSKFIEWIPVRRFRSPWPEWNQRRALEMWAEKTGRVMEE